MISIATILDESSPLLSSDSALLDAEVLLCYVLNKSRSHLRAWPEKILSLEQQQQFQRLLTQRIDGVPIAYLVGKQEFWSRDFKVTADVLIPRPDTELLVELSLALLKNKPTARIIDLGTGSGIIAVTLAAERPDLEVFAVDYSDKALAIAQHNAACHDVNHIQFIQSDWLKEIDPSLQFDLIISNPPYIDKYDVHLSIGDVRFEPKQALIAAHHGLEAFEILVQQALPYLTPNGSLLVEHGCQQQQAVQDIFKQFHYHSIKTHLDLSHHPRVTSGQPSHYE